MLKLKHIVLAIIAFTANSWALESVAQPKSSQQLPPAVVEIAKIQYSQVCDHLTATGTITAIPGIVVKPEVAGRIVNVYFKSGDKVAANTPLVEIYPDILKAQLVQAQADLQLSQLNFERYAKLYTTHTVSKADYDKAKTAADAAKGKVEQYQANLSQTLVRAPFAGKLGINQVSLGQYINAGQNIVSLQALDPIYVDFAIPETAISKIAAGQTINVRYAGYPNEKFSGTVHAIDPLINQKTRSINVRAAIPNKDEKLLPGAFADVLLFVSKQQQVIKIPQTAVVYDTANNYVYRVIDNKAVKTPVTLGQRDAQNVVIQNGLKENDVIVTAGQMKIARDGAPVIVAHNPEKPIK